MAIDIQQYSRRIVVFIVVASVLVFGPIFFFGLSHYTTSSEGFCMSCHRNMEDPGFWEQSKVHTASIGCRQCHGTPEAILETGFTSEDATVSRNCLRCHGNVLIPERETGRVVEALADGLPGAASGPVLFKWKVSRLHHLHFEWSTQCVDCHRHIAHERHLIKTYLPQMETCAECHTTENYVTTYPLPVLSFVKGEES